MSPAPWLRDIESESFAQPVVVFVWYRLGCRSAAPLRDGDGLDDWERSQLREIGEERLLAAVRKQLGSQVKKLYLPPAEDDSAFSTNPFDRDQRTGVPVVPFRAGCAALGATS